MIAAKIAFTLLQLVQYGGPPMWDRGYDNPEYRTYRRPVPPIRGPGGGPEVEPCIRRGDCYGPKYQDRIPRGYPIPPYQYPPERRFDDEYQ